jgi:hypothetical protein
MSLPPLIPSGGCSAIPVATCTPVLLRSAEEGPPAGGPIPASQIWTFNGDLISELDYFYIGINSLRFWDDPTGYEFNTCLRIVGDPVAQATVFADWLNTLAPFGVSGTANGPTVTIAALASGSSGNGTPLVGGTGVTLGGPTLVGGSDGGIVVYPSAIGQFSRVGPYPIIDPRTQEYDWFIAETLDTWRPVFE